MHKPIYSWIDGMDGDTPNCQLYRELWNIYKDAERLYDTRYDSGGTKSEKLEKLLDRFKEGQNLEPKELERFAHLVKANILLRLGLSKGKDFSEPTPYFQQACVILEHCYVPGETSCLNMLIHLALGKYFRSMGEYHQRNDYLRASDEFGELLNTLEQNVREPKKLNNWEAYIWLETALNLSRTDRYLYRIRDAKIRLWDIFRLIAPKAGDKISRLDMKKLLGAEPDWENTCRIRAEQLPDNVKLYDYYAVQALVQMSVAYQKSCNYETAQRLCMITLQIDEANIDAMNNYAVCLQKRGRKARENYQEEAEKYMREHGFTALNKVFTYPAQKILSCLARGNTSFDDKRDNMPLGVNRFATIRYLQACISVQELQNVGPEIDRLLERNPRDQEIRLLKGLYLQRSGDLEGSQEILRALYRDAPQIRRGTIGLKAYYNIGCNLLTQKNFYEAKAHFQKIREESSKSRCDGRENPAPDRGPLLVELPCVDLLAQIDEGWCLMNIGDYRRAKACYEDILNCYRAAPLRQHNETRVRNNLAECCLQLIAQGKDDPEPLFQEAAEQLSKVGKLEPDNATMTRHWGYYYLELGKKEKNSVEGLSRFDEARTYFEKVLLRRADDIYAYSGWVTSAVKLIEGNKEIKEIKEIVFRLIENKIRYAAGVYSIKTCAKLAHFIEESERKGYYENGKLAALYRSLARINLGKTEEGWSRFQNLRENDVFRRMDACRRGELMAVLFQIYEQVLRIKELCRYVPRASEDGFSIPVHYTRIPALKAMVSEDADRPGRLRLWNTVYMNDSFEGEHFINMLRQAKIERLKKESENQSLSPEARAEQMIENYFPYLHRQQSQEDPLIPSNDNTYICSFSEQKDEIHMWVPYADNAKGCALTFTEGFFGLRSSEDRLTDVSSYSDVDYPLYQVQYLDVARWRREGMDYSDPDSQIPKILTVLNNLWELLDKLELRLSGGSLGKPAAQCEDEPCANSDSQQTNQLVRGFVANCLNDVRFLIKDAEYSFEKEIRLIHYSADSRKDAEHFEIPRLFVEMARDVQIREVRLGSKIDEPEANAIVSWLTKTGKVDRITRSGRHYR